MDSAPPTLIVSQYVVAVMDIKKRSREEEGDTKKKIKIEMDRTLKEGQHALYVFYSKSSDEPMPGKGRNESTNDPDNAHALKLGRLWFSVEGYDKPVGFRKMLSNFSRCCDFTYKGHVYRTVEHAFHATKLMMCAEYEGAPRIKLLSNAARLTVDESLDPILTALDAKKMGGRKSNPMTAAQISAWGSPENPDSLRNIEMGAIHEARTLACFENETCGKFARCVLLTRGAKLVHDIGRGKGYEYFVGLEECRDVMWREKKEQVEVFLHSKE